jgi:hypothetical protein
VVDVFVANSSVSTLPLGWDMAIDGLMTLTHALLIPTISENDVTQNIVIEESVAPQNIAESMLSQVRSGLLDLRDK